MNQLVITHNQQAVTSSLQVAETFEKRHDNVMADIKKLTTENSGVKNLFHEATYTNERGREYPMCYMNRDGFTLLAMGFTGSKALQFKLKYIEAFNKMEQQLKQRTLTQEELIKQFGLPANYKEALQHLAGYVEENEQLKAEIESNKEKVVLANAITTSDEGLLIEAAAKYMRQNGVDIGRDRLFKRLRNQGYLVSRKGREWNMPTQKSLNQGLMKIHCHLYYDSEGELKTNRQVVVTGKGLMFFINKFLHEGQLSLSL